MGLDFVKKGLLKFQETHELSERDLKDMLRSAELGQRSVRQGNQVIDMILNAMKEQPLDRDQLTPISVGKATQDIIEQFIFSAGSNPSWPKRIQLNVEEDFSFKGDLVAYTFVLFNLLKNATYYFGQPGVHIDLTVRKPLLMVADNGPGIASEVLPHLFESFMTSNKVQGTGLGLAYCKRTLKEMGGDIRCESTLGQGTTFILTLPPCTSCLPSEDAA